MLDINVIYPGKLGPQSVRQQFLQQPLENGLNPPRYFPVTCSFVVLPLETRMRWNPVSPKIGIKSNEIITMTVILQGEQNRNSY